MLSWMRGLAGGRGVKVRDGGLCRRQAAHGFFCTSEPYDGLTWFVLADAARRCINTPSPSIAGRSVAATAEPRRAERKNRAADPWIKEKCLHRVPFRVAPGNRADLDSPLQF